MHLARLKKAGTTFEVAINPAEALAFRQGTQLDLKTALKDIHVFLDAPKGLRPTEAELRKAFGTVDNFEVAKQILVKGELQLTTEIRAQFREAKKRQLIELIRMYGVDPRTKAPHPVSRIEAALEDVKIDDTQSAEEQVQDIIKELLPVLPIKMEKKLIDVKIPPEFAGKAIGPVKHLGIIKKEEWLNDGSWHAQVEIPGGLEAEVYDRLNSMTHGNAEIQVINNG